MYSKDQTDPSQLEWVTETERSATLSRRDILKVAWTTPIVVAVSPPLRVLAGSGGGNGHDGDSDPDPDTPLPGRDTANLHLSARCGGATAAFTIHNDGGDMTGPSEWRAYEDHGTTLILIASGSFQLDEGESLEIPVSSNGAKVRLIADQPAGYQGPSELMAGITCGNSNEIQT